MSHFYPLADAEDGHHERCLCADDLDRLLLSPPPTDPATAAFLMRWGEPLRALLAEFERLANRVYADEAKD